MALPKVSATEGDLRAMALFMVEKRRVWHKYKSRYDAWKHFGNRPEVCMRYLCSQI